MLIPVRSFSSVLFKTDCKVTHRAAPPWLLHSVCRISLWNTDSCFLLIFHINTQLLHNQGEIHFYNFTFQAFQTANILSLRKCLLSGHVPVHIHILDTNKNPDLQPILLLQLQLFNNYMKYMATCRGNGCLDVKSSEIFQVCFFFLIHNGCVLVVKM